MGWRTLADARAYSQEYRKKHPEQVKASVKAWCEAHSEYRKIKMKEWVAKQKADNPVEFRKKQADKARKWRAANRDRVEAGRRARYLALRAEAIEAYGGKCECCGESRLPFLAFDHIHGGGRKDREARGHKGSGAGWYRYILKNRPDNLRILCHNCNNALGFYGACPHQSEKRERRQEAA